MPSTIKGRLVEETKIYLLNTALAALFRCERSPVLVRVAIVHKQI